MSPAPWCAAVRDQAPSNTDVPIGKSHDPSKIPEYQPALRCGRVHIFVQADKLDAQMVEFVECVDELLHGAREAIKTVDDHHVELAAPARLSHNQPAEVLQPGKQPFDPPTATVSSQASPILSSVLPVAAMWRDELYT